MVEDVVTSLSYDVIYDSFHVPRVGSSGHIPEAGGRGIHRRENIPTRPDCKCYQDSHSDHNRV